MEKDTVKTAELVKEAELLKEAAAIKQALADGKLVDVEGLDVKKIINALNDIKKQNAYLFDAINSLSPHDKRFEQKKKALFGLANQMRYTTESQLRQLSEFANNIKDNMVEMKHMKSMANINKPNRESIKYGESLMSLRKSFLDRAVKRASEQAKTNQPSGRDDSGRTQSER
jgi:hypothetical protein